MKERNASQVAKVPYLVLAGLLGAGLTGSIGVTPTTSDTLAQRQQSGPVTSAPTQTAQAAVAAITAAARQAAPAPMVMADASAAGFNNLHVNDQFQQLRNKLRWLPVKLGTDT